MEDKYLKMKEKRDRLFRKYCEEQSLRQNIERQHQELLTHARAMYKAIDKVAGYRATGCAEMDFLNTRDFIAATLADLPPSLREELEGKE